jgi:hypothetical protein
VALCLWVIVTVFVPTVCIKLWKSAVGIGISILSITTGLLVFESLRMFRPAVASICSIAASAVMLVICILPLLRYRLRLPWFSSAVMLGAVLASAAGHLIYLKLHRKPCRRMFYWYCVITFMYSQVFVDATVFTGLIGTVWVTLAIILGVSSYVHHQSVSRGLLALVGLLCFSCLFCLFMGDVAWMQAWMELAGEGWGFEVVIGPWLNLSVWWILCEVLSFIVERRREIGERFTVAFSGRGYASAKGTAGRTRAKFCKAFSILLENHAVKPPYEIGDLEDEVIVSTYCTSLHAGS